MGCGLYYQSYSDTKLSSTVVVVVVCGGVKTTSNLDFSCFQGSRFSTKYRHLAGMNLSTESNVTAPGVGQVDIVLPDVLH